MKNTYKNIFFLILFLISSLPIYSQRENFRHFSLKDGLPDAFVTSITQTNTGFIYFGTLNGISRFDGKKTINYSTSDGLIGNEVRHIMPYKKHGLLIGTFSGLSVFNGDKFVNYSEKNGLKNKIINTIFKIDEKYLIGTRSGISLFSDGTIKSDSLLNYFDSYRVYSFAFDSDSTLYIGTNSGLFKIIDRKVIIVKKDIVVFSLFSSSDELLFCGTSNGLLKIENNLVKQVKGFEKLSIYDILEDNNKQIWFGTDKGIIKIFGKQIKSYKASDSFLGNECYSIFQDRELNLWFGSEQGVNLNDNGLFQLYDRSRGIKTTVWAIYQTEKGNLWIGTDGNGVLGLRNNEFVKVPVLKKLPKTIWNIFEDSNNHVWFGTNKGAVKLNSKNKLEFYNKSSGFTDDMVIRIFEDKKHNIWLTTYESGIYKYDGNKFTNIILPNGELLPTYDMIEDSKNSLWFASSGGLDKIENDTIVNFPFEETFSQYSFFLLSSN